MKRSQPAILAAAMIFLVASSGACQVVSNITEYFGMCDASAAVAVDSTMFAVASDEDNILRVYRNDRSGSPVAGEDVDEFLKIEPSHPEADLEGATRVGNRIYWISSHGRDRKGKFRPNRHRLFATDVSLEGGKVTLRPFGVFYRDLVADLARLPGLEDCNISLAATKAPQENGALNIEGLSATPDGSSLLIAFRNPIPHGEALLVPLTNPQDVVRGKPAKLGQPIRLPLGGLGFRSIEYHPGRKTYLILAGPSDDTSNFRLYEWSGVPSEAPIWIEAIRFGDLQPEALIVYPHEKDRVQVLSDDGKRTVDGKSCGKAEPQMRKFRSVWVTLE